ncbi:MAG: glycosyltransferase family A protein [Ferruginibacter sp.]
MLIQIYASLVLLYWMVLAFYLLINGRKIKYLKNLESDKTITPSVAFIIAIRNEEADIKDALTSVCLLDYSNLKIIVVNDRSTDGTAEILGALNKTFPFQLLTITGLPSGWLGKNNALYTATQSADANYFLFTDADVIFHKDTLAKAISFAHHNNLDHLTVLPEITARSAPLRGVFAVFIMMLTTLQRPWAAKKKSSKASIGVGAFNLVKKEAYLHAGTHKAIAMRPDDDLQLAALIKKSGGCSDVLYGMGALQVEWYKSVNEFINGLMKNAFSGFHYSIMKVAGGVLGVLLFFVLPLPLLLTFGNCTEWVILFFTMLCQLILFWKMPGAKNEWWFGLTIPYSGMIMIYIFIKAAYTNTRDGGITWRDTFYSLNELRNAKRS